ncbi:MAG: hypothetical protein Q9216_002737 [Gyalolechia sp. 2 TL-2023]
MFLTVSCAMRIPGHDLVARRAARESRPKPWRLPKASGLNAISVSLTASVDAWGDWYTPTADSSIDWSSSTSSQPMSFTSPLPATPTTIRGNEFLEDLPELDFLRYFLEPCRTVDIPVLQKFHLANYLRRTVEASCHEWYRRWMPEEQARLIILDGPDQLDLPAWIALVQKHLCKNPKEAFAPKLDSWMILQCERIRHRSVHRGNYTTDFVLDAVRLACGLKDVERAKQTQEVVKRIYDDLSNGEEPGCHFFDLAPSSRLPSKPQPNQFRMLYSVLDIVCRLLFRRITLEFPDDFQELSLEQLEWADLECWVRDNFYKLQYLMTLTQASVDRLMRSCRTIRNSVEHRGFLSREATRAMVEDAASLMSVIGEHDAAVEIQGIFQRVDDEMRHFVPNDDSPFPILFLRAFKRLSCWRVREQVHSSCVSPSSSSSPSSSQDLIPRSYHPYRHCMQPIFDILAELAQQARCQQYFWQPKASYSRDEDFGLSQAYRLTGRWYEGIATGELEVDEARSPVVDAWEWDWW